MPIYEYRCDACNELTEALRRMADADEAMACEHCGSARTRRVLSMFAAQAASTPGGGEVCAPVPSGGCGHCGSTRHGSCGA